MDFDLERFYLDEILEVEKVIEENELLRSLVEALYLELDFQANGPECEEHQCYWVTEKIICCIICGRPDPTRTWGRSILGQLAAARQPPQRSG